MSLRLYFDEDTMDQALLRALKGRGVDVESALSADMRRRPDARQLEYATAQGRALYSFNIGDFCRLHAEYVDQGRSHAGLILAQQQRFSVGEQLRRLLRIVAALTPEDMKNRVEFLSTW